jgi:hypothetical protein
MAILTEKLQKQFEQSNHLQQKIKNHLQSLVGGEE